MRDDCCTDATAAGDSGAAAPITVWFEVEDYFQYFDDSAKPVGIPRVQMELFAQFERKRRVGAVVRYCRLNRFSHRLDAVSYAEIQQVFRNPPLAHAPWLVGFAPPLLRLPARWIADGMLMIGRLCRGAVARLLGRPIRLRLGSADIHAGDVIVCTGMSWVNARYGELIAAAKRDFGISFVMLFHDIIPIAHPRFSRIVPRFRRWTDALLKISDRVMTQSRYSRDALLAHAKEIGLPLGDVVVLRLGATFTPASPATVARRSLALPRPYVLFVSTIEIRKNHLLLVRVWKRLVERHGADRIPALIFVGARGWLVRPLWAELAASRYLDGKIRILSGLSDAELELCYRYCLFTAYPSFVEGWGLPVAESLQHGKLCIASNRSSLPEVGGELVDYFDPEDEEAAFAAIERAIFDRQYREAREAQIRRDYRAPDWAQCAETLLQTALAASRKAASPGAGGNAAMTLGDPMLDFRVGTPRREIRLDPH